MTSVNAKTLIDLLKRHFFSRTDRAAVKYDGRITPIVVSSEADLDAVLLTHVLDDQAPEAVIHYVTQKTRGVAKGRYRVGSYTPAPDDTTAWLCIDIDGPGHANSVADPDGVARMLATRFAAYDIPAYIERSGGGKGWHVWVFFEHRIPAALARKLATVTIPGDIPLKAGGYANAEKSKGIEIFPKQEKIRKGGYGNCLWLPWWADAPSGACQFYTFGEDGPPVRYVPEEFKTTSLDAVNDAIQRVEADELEELYKTVPIPDTADAFTGEWKQWRKEALAALPLQSVYGEWLTGNTSGDGWLECRDPDSPSGDKNPSAGVADTTDQAQRGSFHSFISGKTMSVFDFMIARGTARDFRHAVRLVAELSGRMNVFRNAAAATKQPADAPAALPRRARPAVQVNNRLLDRMLAETWQAIFKANRDPVMFARYGSLVEIRYRADGPCIEEVSRDALFEYLGRVADWIVVTEHATFDTVPSRDVVRGVAARPHKDLPALEAVLTCPVFGRAGAPINTPGYHSEDRAWYAPADLNVPEAPEKPTENDIAAAKSLLLDDLVADFPFVSPSDRAHWLAALILPFVRRMIPRPTPLHFVEAPCNGAGKTLLCDIISLVLTGGSVNAQTLPQNDDEVAKVITAELLQARPIILLDNQSEWRKLNSVSLSSALTTTSWTGRLLGQTKMLSLTNHALWMMTGNNPTLTTEMARRAVRIRIDPKRDRAWLRDPEEFRHPDIKEWVCENRGQIIRAIHVLVNAWIAAGKPAGRGSMGSYEKWAKVIGGILHTAGVPGFLECQKEMYREADADGAEWQLFVNTWWDEYADAPQAVSGLNTFCETNDLLSGVRGDGNLRSQESRLGRALNSVRDRMFGNLRIVTAHDVKYSKGRRMYCLVREDGDNNDGDRSRSDSANGNGKATRAPSQVELIPSENPANDLSRCSKCENVPSAPVPGDQCRLSADLVQTSESQSMHSVTPIESTSSEGEKSSADLCILFPGSYASVRARVIDNIYITRARGRGADGEKSAQVCTDGVSGQLSLDAATPCTSAYFGDQKSAQSMHRTESVDEPLGPIADGPGAGANGRANSNGRSANEQKDNKEPPGGAGASGTNGTGQKTPAGKGDIQPAVQWIPTEPPPGAGEAWEDPNYIEPTGVDGSKVLDPWDPGYDPANDPFYDPDDEGELS